MSVNDAHARLSKAGRELLLQWNDLRTGWQDEAAENFGCRYIEPLENELRKSAMALEQLAALSAKIKSQCS